MYLTDEETQKIKELCETPEGAQQAIEMAYKALWSLQDDFWCKEFASLDEARGVLVNRTNERALRNHGQYGGFDVYVYQITVLGVPYTATAQLTWSRYDKQFYYLLDPTTVTFALTQCKP
jgi:hypothetical protein